MTNPNSKVISALLLLTLLQACGGGGGDEQSGADSSNSAATPSSPANASTATQATATPEAACGLANFEADALRIVNAVRAAGAVCGTRGAFAPAGALTWNSQLASAAYAHSRDMADNDYFSHDSQDGRTMVDRINAAGYSWSTVGENIAAGYGSVQAVVDGWMASDGHCANLMNPRFTEFGMACARQEASKFKTYWTQDLGRP